MALTNRLLSELFLRGNTAMQVAAEDFRTLRKSASSGSDGVLLCHVRDEIEHLPHLLKHYREIGVKRFAFVDNGSLDNTVPFLLDQADCDVFQTAGSFRSALAGMVWKNMLLRHYPWARWYLSVDADEHAVYDGWPGVGLDEFAASLSRKGRSVVTAIMVDMYGAGPLARTRAEPGKSLLEAAPLFDGDGYRIAMPDDWRAEDFPRLNIRGGPVMRLFGEDRLGWLAKTPLLLEPNLLFFDPHGVFPAGLNFAAPRIALLHFRFLDSIVGKITRIAERAMHSEGNISTYRKLGDKLRDQPDFSFAYPGSVRFESPAQFVERGMIRSAQDAAADPV